MKNSNNDLSFSLPLAGASLLPLGLLIGILSALFL